MTQNERNELIEKYAAGYDEVKKALDTIPMESLTTRPAPDKWSACEVVQHLADSEMRSALRIRQLLTETNPIIQGYDQDLYATKFDYNSKDIMPALEAFKSSRAITVPLLQSMTEDEWKRTGTHSESGHFSAEDWLRIYSGHAHNHAEQIKRIIQSL